MTTGAKFISRCSPPNYSTFHIGAVMNRAVVSRKLTMTNSVAVAFALAVGAAGIAHADDSSMSRFGGDSYAYFHEDKPVVSRALSEFRKEDPHGLTESQYQTLSSEGPEWQPRPSIDKTLPSFRKTDPHGLSISEYQALSSNDSMWQVPTTPPT